MDKYCTNGHVIDASWDLCPWCPPGTPARGFPVVQPRTQPPSSGPGETRPGLRQPTPAAPAKPAGREEGEPPVSRTVAVPRSELGMGAQPNRYVAGWLVALTGSARGESYPIRVGKNTIGRDRRNDVTVFDDQASSHHADLIYRPEENRFILMDANSTNGTFLNGREIEPRSDLQNRDVIRIGAQKLLFFALCGEDFRWDDDPRSQ